MRGLLIVTGPSEEPFGVTVLSDEDAFGTDQDSPRMSARSQGERSRSRHSGRARLTSGWARRACAILVGLKQTLVSLVPLDGNSAATELVEVQPRSSFLTPRLRLVSDCGRALAIAHAAEPECRLARHDAITPRHRVRALRSACLRRRRWRWR